MLPLMSQRQTFERPIFISKRLVASDVPQTRAWVLKIPRTEGCCSAVAAGLVVAGLKKTERYVEELPGASLVVTSLEQITLDRIKRSSCNENR